MTLPTEAVAAPLLQLVQRAEQLMQRIEAILPQPLQSPADWNTAIAWRYRKRANGCGLLEPVRHVGAMQLSDLQNIDVQKDKIARNTEQFVTGRTANNVLLTGARGTGKSSLIRADRKSTRLNSSHSQISYAVFCLKQKLKTGA